MIFFAVFLLKIGVTGKKEIHWKRIFYMGIPLRSSVSCEEEIALFCSLSFFFLLYFYKVKPLFGMKWNGMEWVCVPRFTQSLRSVGF